MAHRVSRRPHAAQHRTQTHVGLCEIYDEHRATGTRFSLSSEELICQYNSTSAPYSLISYRQRSITLAVDSHSITCLKMYM